jgi:PilZ domain
MGPRQKTDPRKVLRNPADKRLWPRYPFTPAVEAVDIQANTRITGRLSDIAKKGCYMDTISPFATKAAVTLTITKNNQSFKTEANVVYSQIGMGMGLCFTTAEPSQQRLLETWLEELSGGKQCEPDALHVALQPIPAKSARSDLRETLGELIILLSRKDIISDSEAQVLLRRLAKHSVVESEEPTLP